MTQSDGEPGHLDPEARTSRASTRRDRTATVLAGVGWITLAAAVAAVGAVLIVEGPLWFSAARIAGFLTAVAFAAAFFSAAAGRRSARAGEASASASQSAADAAHHAYGHQLYELARSLHADLTGGEVAAARDRLGSLGRDRRAFCEQGATGPLGRELHESMRTRMTAPEFADADTRFAACRRAWFTLLWCFQRVLSAHTLLTQAPHSGTAERETPHAFFERLVGDQIRYLNSEAELVQARCALEEFFEAPVDDHELAAAFRELVPLLLPGQQPGRWAQPLSTTVPDALLVILLAQEDFAFETLTDRQFHQVHRAVDIGQGEVRILERRTLSDLVGQRADALEQAGKTDPAGRLRNWASALRDTHASTHHPDDGPEL